MRTPIAIACILLLLTGSLGPGSTADPLAGSADLDALRVSLSAEDGFVGLAPALDGSGLLHAVFSGDAPALPPAPLGWTWSVHEDTAPERLRVSVDSVTDVKDLSERQRDGVPPLPEDAVGIGPGTPILVTIPGEGTFICTANYVFEDGGRVYLGSAGHCFIPSGKKATHGSGADYDASGVKVAACVNFCFFGGLTTGFLGSFVTLGQVSYARQTGSGGDIGNDFGVVEIPASAQPYVRAEMPMWEGPTGLDGTERTGGMVVHYGNGIDAGTFMPTKGRAGTGLNDGDAKSWTANILINGGDSGSAINHGSTAIGTDVVEGRAALGVVTHGIITGVVPLGWGTTIEQGISMATEAGLSLDLLLEGETLGSGGGGSTTTTDVHVRSIDTSFSHFGGNGHRLATTVVVEDAQGVVAAGVDVAVEVTSPESNTYTASGTTDSTGSVTLTVQQKGGGHGTWTACVTGLTGIGYNHDSASDKESCQSQTVS